MKKPFMLFLLSAVLCKCAAQPIQITTTNTTTFVAGYGALSSCGLSGTSWDIVVGSFHPTIEQFVSTKGFCEFPQDSYATRPGSGYILTSFAPMTISFANPSVQVLPLPLPAGFSIICCQSNIPATFDIMVGRPPDDGTRLYRYTNAPYILLPMLDGETNYMEYAFTNGSWNPEEPVVNIGEAVWVYQPPEIANAQLTGTNFTFDALTAWRATTAVEYADSLAGPWQTLTNFSGSGGWPYNGWTNVVDPGDITTNGQRFYRINVY